MAPVGAVGLEKQQVPCRDRKHWHQAGNLWSVWCKLAGMGAGSSFGPGQWWPSGLPSSPPGSGTMGCCNQSHEEEQRMAPVVAAGELWWLPRRAQEPLGDPASQRGRTRAWDSVDLLPQARSQWLVLLFLKTPPVAFLQLGEGGVVQVTPIP